MKRSLLVVLSFVAACGGALAKEDDGGIIPPPNKDAAPNKDSGPKPPPPDASPPPFDAEPIDVTVIDVGPPCQFSICNGQCVDTSSDPNNCGGCNNTCTDGTCVNYVCTTTTTNEPPQGTCAHSLCDDSTALVSGCDTVSCVSAVCANDDFCCTTSWDSICVGEVASYCSGYSCP